MHNTVKDGTAGRPTLSDDRRPAALGAVIRPAYTKADLDQSAIGDS
jgi:hypothetical protein